MTIVSYITEYVVGWYLGLQGDEKMEDFDLKPFLCGSPTRHTDTQ